VAVRISREATSARDAVIRKVLSLRIRKVKRAI
jgi:hypothetical protein